MNVSAARVAHRYLLRRAAMVRWNADDLLLIEPVPSKLRSFYPASNVARKEKVLAEGPGQSAGQGVYQGVLGGGQPVTFYGWQVVSQTRTAFDTAPLADDVATSADGYMAPMPEWEPTPAPSAESLFFDNPVHRELRQFAQTRALTNVPAVIKKDVSELDIPESEALAETAKTPPLPSEIAKGPGGKELSTLNRFLINTKDPDTKNVPEHRDEIPKHPDLKEATDRNSWLLDVWFS